MLTTIERRQAIVELTNELGKVNVAELSEKYLVSTVTIRNDLNSLDKKRIDCSLPRWRSKEQSNR